MSRTRESASCFHDYRVISAHVLGMGSQVLRALQGSEFCVADTMRSKLFPIWLSRISGFLLLLWVILATEAKRWAVMRFAQRGETSRRRHAAEWRAQIWIRSANGSPTAASP